jgi:hypothetical protein
LVAWPACVGRLTNKPHHRKALSEGFAFVGRLTNKPPYLKHYQKVPPLLISCPSLLVAPGQPQAG